MSDQIVAERLVNSLYVKHDVRIRVGIIAGMRTRSVHVHLFVKIGQGRGKSDGQDGEKQEGAGQRVERSEESHGVSGHDGNER